MREGTIHYLGYALGGGRYAMTQLVPRTLAVAGTLTTLGDDQVRACAVAYLHSDSAISPVYGGTGWGSVADAEMFGGSYKYSSDTGATATWTTPAGTTRTGMLYYRTTNGGICKVSIDGDATRANLLPTAQERVTAGFLASTALVANGGTLNPTDRVLDQYRYTSTALKNAPVLFADDLAAGAHVIVLTVTGYKHTHVGAVGTRLYADALLAGSTTTGVGGVNVFLPIVASFSGDTGSAKELAIQFVPPEQVSAVDFLGNIHDYEYQDSIVYTVDGATVTPTDGQILTGQVVGAMLASHLRHPDTGVTDVALIAKQYEAQPATGLRVQQTIIWQHGGETRRAYVAMYPLGTTFNRGSEVGATLDFDLDPNSGGFVVAGARQVAYLWQATGLFGAALYVPDPVVTVNNWTYSSPTIAGLAIEDRAAGTTNKAYLTRSTEFTPEPVGVGDVWQSEVYYRIQRFPNGANAALADEYGLTFALALTQASGGTAMVAPDDVGYDDGEFVVLSATSDSGYSFIYWSLNGQRFHTNPLAVNVSQDLAVSPYFALTIPLTPAPIGAARCPFCRGGDRCPVCGSSGWVRA
jgi:hypothetical protein